jgi:hypothetical protein
MTKISMLLRELAQEFDSLESMMNGRFDYLQDRVDKQDKKFNIISDGLRETLSKLEEEDR